MSLSSEVAKGFVAKVVQAGFGFVGTIIFARVLGPTGFGGFYLLLSLTQFPTRAVLGVSTAVQKRYAEVGSRRGQLVGTLVVVTLGSLAAVAVGVFAFRGFLISYTGLPAAPVLFVMLFVTTASFPIYQNLLTSIGRLSVQTWIDTVRSVVTFAFQLLFVAASYGAAGMAYGLALGTALLLPLTQYYLRTVPVIPSRETLRSVWSFARYSVPSKIVGNAFDRFDVILLGFLASPAAVGQYEVAYKLTVPAMFVAGLSGNGLMATLSDLESRDEEFREEVYNTLAFSSLFAIPLFFGALAISQATVVTVYGPEYRSAAALLIGLALHRVVSTQSTVLMNIVNGLDSPELQFRASIVTLLANVPLGIALYVWIGPVGVVIATVLAETVRYVMLFGPAKRLTGVTLLPRALFEQVIAGAAMFVAVELLQGVVSVRSWVDFAFLLAVGGLAYFGLLTAGSRHFRVTMEGVWESLYPTPK